MKTKLIFLFRLLIISLLLFLCIGWIGKMYQRVLFEVCYMLLPSPPREIRLEYISYLRTVPFLALMLATPGIKLGKRVTFIVVGMAVFVAMDAAGIITWGKLPDRGATAAHVIFSLIWQTAGQWILPFLFWFLAVYRNIGELFSDKYGNYC